MGKGTDREEEKWEIAEEDSCPSPHAVPLSSDPAHVLVPEKGVWRKLLAYLGPGFLVAIAYIDPANFESDLQAGASFQYSLLWVLLLASVGGLIIQSLSANLGIVTEKHLAQHCRLEYPKALNWILWFIAEVEIIASDIPEVIGTAFALNMLFRLKVWVGVIFTGLSTILLLALQRYGIRKLEMFIALLVLIMALCFFSEMAYTSIDEWQVLEGLVVPRLASTHATAIAISLVGAVVMPHNLFLHSALVLSRKQLRTERAIQEGCRYAFVEVMIALVVAFAINVSVICVGGAVCNAPNMRPLLRQNCDNITLNNAFFLLQNTLGTWSSKIFGIALLASGQSSTITGTYAGQYVMQGFLDLGMKTWIRNLITRLVAIIPSLVVALLFGSKGASQLIIICSMILSFGLPYALIPLLKFTSSPIKMGPFVNSPLVTGFTWGIGFFVIAINCCFLLQVFFIPRLSSAGSLHLMSRVPLAILVLCLVFFYLASLLFLAFRKDIITTYSVLETAPRLKGDEGGGGELEEEDEDGKTVEEMSLLDGQAQWSGKIISRPNRGGEGEDKHIPEIEFSSPRGNKPDGGFLFFELEGEANQQVEDKFFLGLGSSKGENV